MKLDDHVCALSTLLTVATPEKSAISITRQFGFEFKGHPGMERDMVVVTSSGFQKATFSKCFLISSSTLTHKAHVFKSIQFEKHFEKLSFLDGDW